LKILIVDDKKENLYLLETLLKGYGHEVATARNGVEALEALKKDSIDMIISDVLMPKMDGFQLCRECKRDEALRKIPIIFYTAAYTSKKDEVFALSLGVDRYIVKPVEPEDLIATINSVYDKYQKGLVAPSAIIPEKEEEVYLKEYSERLIKQLEKRMENLEEANRRLNEEIEERKRAEKQFRDYVFDVADSLRNPLQVFKGNLENFDTSNLNPGQLKMFKEIQNASKLAEINIKRLTIINSKGQDSGGG
jgi:CheY-like chemotaxis protein